MNLQPNIQGLLDFAKFTYDFREIERVIYTHKGARKENDSEHSFQLAIVSRYIATSYSLSYDIEKILLYSLVHDLVEMYAGDIYSFASQELIQSQHDREIQALKIIQKRFSYFPQLGEVIKNYEDRSDEESKFIYFIDKLIPVINIYNSGGYERKTDGLTLEDEKSYMKRKMEGVEIPSRIYEIRNEMIELLVKHHDELFI